MSDLTFKFRTLKVKLTFKLKYDIYEVLRVLYMRRQRFFSFLKNIHILLYFISSLITFIFELFTVCKRLTSMRKRLSAHFYVSNSNFETYNL